MKRPIARPTAPEAEHASRAARSPRAFTPVEPASPVETFTEDEPPPETTPEPRRRGWTGRLALGAGGLLLSLGLALAAERLIRDLFARYEWLGYVGLAALAVFVIAALGFILREILALMRLRKLDIVRDQAAQTLLNDSNTEGRQVLTALAVLYSHRADLARSRLQLADQTEDMFDGADMVRTAERLLMGPLDARARKLTAASARRVAIVTAISPRALVDIAFVGYESFRLARTIAELYGARPGLIGSWRLAKSILGHLAVTGGVALGDSVIQQLIGHGLAARLSARLGEGLVNGLMTVRVGIAAMRVTRPLPFDVLKQPVVMDFSGDLARVAEQTPRPDKS